MPKVFIPNETGRGEARVAATPETVRKMADLDLEVWLEKGAGNAAHFAAAEYAEAGAREAGDAAEAWSTADIVLTVGAPSLEQAGTLAAGAALIGLLSPWTATDLVRTLAERKVTALPMELIPRITRAQSMDALSSQANIAGYKAVLLGAARLDRYFPLLMTAAGTVRPARVLVMGAGVAGLQAIATAKRLGAVVEVTDIRPAVKEQVASLGGRFIDLPGLEGGEGKGGYAKEVGEDFLERQRAILTEHVAASDVVLTTALVPGKRAPTLLTRAMVEAMRPGAVVVDLAAEQGGNCELTRAGEEVEHGGVVILGPANLPGSLPRDASALYSRNVLGLLHEILGEGGITIDRENDVIGPTLLTYQGEVVHAAIAERMKGTSS
jgi:proton-translocating NAD(P)+ transhydrogenase subunit alpha